MQPPQNVKWERREFLIPDRAGRKGKEGEKRNHQTKSRHGETEGPEHLATEVPSMQVAVRVDAFACAGLCTCVCVCVQTH